MIRLAPGADPNVIAGALLGLACMSQADLARTTGYAEGQISRWRRGVVVPTVPVLIRLADALGYDLALIPRKDTP